MRCSVHLMMIGLGVMLLSISCSGDNELRRPASLSLSFTVDEGVSEPYDPERTYVMAAPGQETNFSIMDVTIFNIGEGDTDLLNVYLGASSNPYVEILWPDKDPKGGAYTTNDPVVACVPDDSELSDPSILPTARDANPAGCNFPLLLEGELPNGTFDSRKIRLKYTFDVDTMEPDESPVSLVIQIDWREDKLTNEGVLVIPIAVEGCIPHMVYGPTSVTFLAAKPGQPEKQEICLHNDGCVDLEVSSVTLEYPSPGEVFSIVEQKNGFCAENDRIPCDEDLDCPKQCSDGSTECPFDEKFATICTPSADYKPLQDTVVAPLAQNPDEELCFYGKYSPQTATSSWDEDCSSLALENCDVCESNPSSDCCTTKDLPGCEDNDCEAVVCDEEPLCCQERDDNFIVIETNDPTQPTVKIPLTPDTCQYEYELTHTDAVDSGLVYVDFGGVVFPDRAQKTITVTNLGLCPVTLHNLSFGNSQRDPVTQGGPFWAEIQKDGATTGRVGYPASSNNLPLVLQNQNDVLHVVVHFEPVEDQVTEPTEIILSLRSGGGETFTETLTIQAGEAQSSLALGPAVGGSDNQAHLWFAVAEPEQKIKTLALYNHGLAPQPIDSITLDNGFGQSPVDFTLVDDDYYVIDGEFVAEEIPPLGVIPIEIAFEPVSGAFDTDAFIYVWTPEEPFGSAEFSSYVVNLEGKAGLVADLPEAWAGTTEDYEGYSAGDTIPLNGDQSIDGEAEIIESGYIWWLTDKPEESAAQLNLTGRAQTSLKVDKPGSYYISLVVIGVVSGGDTQTHFSDEDWVEIIVE